MSSWWKSPRVRAVRHRISDQQVLLFPVLGALVRFWCWMIQRTVDYERRGPLFEFIQQKRPCIITLWHQDVFPLMFELFRYTPSYPAMFMVSPGRIGSVGAYLLNIWGIRSVAGSRGSTARETVEVLSREAKAAGVAVFLMADGSRGPARTARWGAIHLAKNTGFPLIAARAWSDRLVTLERTWMKLALPRPWGRAVVLSASPMLVPQTEDRDILNAYRDELERRLNQLADAATAYFALGLESPAPSAIAEGQLPCDSGRRDIDSLPEP